jgi:hypothetical protein
MSLAAESLALRVQAEHISDAVLPGIGRPSRLLEPDTLHLVLAALADGVSRENAARQADIAPKTFFNWLKQAEAGNEAAMAFLQAVEKAEASVEQRCTRNVLKASELPQFWAAGMTYLERRWPDRWGRRQDDQSVPKVIVQIGARDVDVQIAVSPSTFAPQDALSTPANLLTHSAYASSSCLINGDYVTQPAEPAATPDQAQPARDPSEGPTPGGAYQSVGRAVQGKGRSREKSLRKMGSRHGQETKKKGVVG